MTRIGISHEEALATILQHLAPLGPETIPLAEAVGRTLAADVVAPHPLPAFATDGPGAYIVHAGHALRPEEIGLLAGLGMREARVVRRPRVAIVAIGDELVPPGAAPAPDKVYDSDSPLIAALVRREGGLPQLVGIAHDSHESVRLRLAGAIGRGAELIVAVAGSHPDDHDLVAELLSTEGRLHCCVVELGHDRPLLFGELAGVPVIGLPGTPAEAAASAERYVRPAVRALAGFDEVEPQAAGRALVSPL